MPEPIDDSPDPGSTSEIFSGSELSDSQVSGFLFRPSPSDPFTLLPDKCLVLLGYEKTEALSSEPIVNEHSVHFGRCVSVQWINGRDNQEDALSVQQGTRVHFVEIEASTADVKRESPVGEDSRLFDDLSTEDYSAENNASTYEEVGEPTKVLWLKVADGLGGHGYGEFASRTVIETTDRAIERTASITESCNTCWTGMDGAITNRTREIRETRREAQKQRTILQLKEKENAEAIQALEIEIRNAERAIRAYSDMSSTLTALQITEDGNTELAYLGDSPTFVLRDGKIIYRTKDHTLLQEWFDALDEVAAGRKWPNEKPDSVETYDTDVGCTPVDIEPILKKHWSDPQQLTSEIKHQVLIEWATEMGGGIVRNRHVSILLGNYITRAISDPSQMKESEMNFDSPDDFPDLQDGDIVLQSSDALASGFVEILSETDEGCTLGYNPKAGITPQQIEFACSNEESLTKIAQNLMALVKDCGETDNCTFHVYQFLAPVLDEKNVPIPTA